MVQHVANAARPGVLRLRGLERSSHGRPTGSSRRTKPRELAQYRLAGNKWKPELSQVLLAQVNQARKVNFFFVENAGILLETQFGQPRGYLGHGVISR